ncbi:MAG: hypothetical protein GF401_04800 [Chitinivibrionales bacterium]|nr:hypothetical protein [Chitinivibrionales bacterium]
MKEIKDPKALAREAADEYKSCYRDKLVSVILFGSAAGGDFDPKSSDINLLIILNKATLQQLEKSGAIQEKWMKKRFTRPLFMDKEYISRSLDSFPVEFLNMRGCYEVLFGEDVLAGLTIKDEDLRLQIERELKGKQLHLMQDWLEVRNKSGKIKDLLGISIHDFAASFRAMLHLKGEDVPRDRLSLFAAIDKAYSLEKEPLTKTLQTFQSGDKSKMAAVFPEYAQAIKQLTAIIDEKF